MNIRTKVVGVTKSNPDGTDRQDVLFEEITGYSDLYLKREPENPHDQNAVAVYLGGKDIQLGYIKSELAEEVARKLDKGVALYITDFDVTGGEHGKNLGLNIQIETENTSKRERLEREDKRRDTIGMIVLSVIVGAVALFAYFVYWVFSFF